MYLHALATALPPAAFTQAECWNIVQRSEARQRLNRRSVLTLQAILRHDSGIATRHFAMPDIKRVFSLTPDELNEGFRLEAPRLAARALASALRQAGLDAGQVDALLICTCTGYLCPGVTSYVAEQLGLRTDVFLQDLVGLGCGAAIPSLRAAQAVLALQPTAVVAKRACRSSGVWSKTSASVSRARCRVSMPLSPQRTFLRMALDRGLSCENFGQFCNAPQASRWA
jgi:alkylresorcinol/alkylpyrone synthase